MSLKASRHGLLLTKKRGCKAKQTKTETKKLRKCLSTLGLQLGDMAIARIPKWAPNCEYEVEPYKGRNDEVT